MNVGLEIQVIINTGQMPVDFTVFKRENMAFVFNRQLRTDTHDQSGTNEHENDFKKKR